MAKKKRNTANTPPRPRPDDEELEEWIQFAYDCLVRCLSDSMIHKLCVERAYKKGQEPPARRTSNGWCSRARARRRIEGDRSRENPEEVMAEVIAVARGVIADPETSPRVRLKAAQTLAELTGARRATVDAANKKDLVDEMPNEFAITVTEPDPAEEDEEPEEAKEHRA